MFGFWTFTVLTLFNLIIAFSAGLYIAAVTNKGTAYMFEFNRDLREGATPTATMGNPKKK